MNTKDKILKAAEKLFYQNGIDRTSIKDIAKESGTNIAALNYHFKTKENLIDMLFSKMLSVFDPILPDIFAMDLSLVLKIRKFIDTYTALLVKFNPYISFFIMSMLQRNPKKILNLKLFSSLYNPTGLFTQMEQEIATGRINKIDPLHFFITILSLIGFPFAMQNILIPTNSWKRKDFELFVTQRTDMIYFVAMAILNDQNIIHP
ncbi:MAG: TetR/AcrR family transcriptional regulator [Bacteroidales bacterium]|nr:TetR/AcrR family transcriptional regulator [Bacteroidales bacterium]